MKVINIDGLLDGGSILIETTESKYYIDDRLLSTTPNIIYLNYPSNIDAKRLTSEEKGIVLNAIKDFKNNNSKGDGMLGFFIDSAIEVLEKNESN